MRYVAYLRVSTDKQGSSGLGLQAQETAISAFLKSGDEVIASYKDIESGKKSDRPQLMAALEHCKKEGATLLIAKLDRLSRNVAFIFNLRDSGVDFVCCDMPDANTMTIGILALFAQHEREMISKRTKEALASRTSMLKYLRDRIASAIEDDDTAMEILETLNQEQAESADLMERLESEKRDLEKQLEKKMKAAAKEIARMERDARKAAEAFSEEQAIKEAAAEAVNHYRLEVEKMVIETKLGEASMEKNKKPTFTEEVRAKGIETVKANATNDPKNQEAANIIRMLADDGKSLSEIAERLNRLGKTTRGNGKIAGGSFSITQVHRLCKRYGIRTTGSRSGRSSITAKA